MKRYSDFVLRIADVTVLGPNRLRLTLTDGSVVERDVSALLWGPVFDPLRQDPQLFAQAEVVDGTVAWPNGADLCPDVLIWGGAPPDPQQGPPPKALVLR